MLEMSEELGSLGDTLGATQVRNEGEATRPRRRVKAGLERGTLVGRYLVLARLGAGGMGVVYAAYDPELDRKVALKLLLPSFEGASATGKASKRRGRLLREAQALAKLQHPNVVTIHDVGEHEERVWLAMEHVEGRTLGAWRKERPRSWAEVLDVLVRTGRGVAAAHAAGLLHRDLKPDNVMVAADGRVRVMDFGLARTRGDASEDGSSKDGSTDGEEGARPNHEALEMRMTQAGALLGTPAYMAPEQFSGREVGEATDQFSLCVTLWEALYGERPFVGETLPELMTRVLEGERRPPPRGARVPAWLRRVVERGLSLEAKQRWPSMEALLEALERGQKQARFRRGLGVAGLLGLGAAAFAGWQELDRRRGIAACERAGHDIAEVWNEEARHKLREALVDTGVSHAQDTANKVMPWLDVHARAWQSARTDACLDAEVHGTWDEDVHERAKWCLDERRMELEALVEELSRGTPESIPTAVLAAAGLERIEPCRERDLLVRKLNPPAEHREEVRAVRTELSRAAALQRTGAYAAGLEVALDALERAQALDWPPLTAAARLRLGRLLDKTGAHAEAEETLEAAYFGAAKAGAVEVATDAADVLVHVVGYRLARHAEGLRWSRLAEIGLASLPDVAGVREAIHFHNLANVHWATGTYDVAKGLYERALAIYEKTLGLEHPDVAMSLNNLAAVHLAMGTHDEAKRLFERALAIREKALGLEHPDVAMSLNNLALVHHAVGTYDEAKELFERALVIDEKALGPEHPDVARSLSYLAAIHQAMGTYDEAKGLCERGLAIYEKALGLEHPDVAMSLNNLAAVHLAMGTRDEAKGLFERALAIYEKAMGPEHPLVAHPLVGLARLALYQGRVADAVAFAERAVKIRENADAPAADLAGARFVLARATWDAGEDRSHALGLAEAARQGWRETGHNAEEVAETEAWLAKRRRAE
jgi:eukaryotic-like serine/threonine-protein kinase